MDALIQGFLDRDFVLLLTGPAGVGKTAVLDAALDAFAGDGIRIVRLSNPVAAAWDRTAVVAQILGISTETAAFHAGAAADAAELTEAATGETHVVVAADDAQRLTDDAMEFLLMLASPAGRAGPPAQLVLSGQGDFWKREWRPELRLIADLAQRVRVQSLTHTETADYLAYHLAYTGDSIAPDAAQFVFGVTSGLPAAIREILAALPRGGHPLTLDNVRDAIGCADADEPRDEAAPVPPPPLARRRSSAWTTILVGVVFIAVGIAGGRDRLGTRQAGHLPPPPAMANMSLQPAGAIAIDNNAMARYARRDDRANAALPVPVVVDPIAVPVGEGPAGEATAAETDPAPVGAPPVSPPAEEKRETAVETAAAETPPASIEPVQPGPDSRPVPDQGLTAQIVAPAETPPAPIEPVQPGPDSRPMPDQGSTAQIVALTLPRMPPPAAARSAAPPTAVIHPAGGKPTAANNVRPRNVAAEPEPAGAIDRCRNILLRISLGEELSNENRTRLRTDCKEHP